ncbi:MAG: gamma-butyrobetaine hydroxylase-like domain-containing protein [Bryobacteraceae bacterium]
MPHEIEQNTMADPEHIAISKSGGIKIDWRDGHHSDYPLAWLRDKCPCATCSGAHGTAPERSSYSKPAAFPMFRPALKMSSVEPVGQYAIRIYWNDGHSTGIYSFDHLRSICPCEECRAKQGEG